MDSTTTARFHHPAGTGTPWWSDELYELLGMAPGDVPPTLDALLRHVRLDERKALQAAVDACRLEGRPFAHVHTVQELRGGSLVLAVAGMPGPPDEDGLHDVDGVVLDVSNEVADRAARQVNERLPELVAGRSALEQAVGALGVVYGTDRATTIEFLRWTGRRRGLDLTETATAAMAAVEALGGDVGPDQDGLERAILAAVDRAERRPDGS